MSPTYAADLSALFTLVQALWAQTNTRYAILMLIAAGVFFVVTNIWGKDSSKASTTASENSETRAKYQQKIALPKAGNRSWLGRRLHRWIEPVTIAGVTIEASQKHIAIGATTGARKALALDTLVPTPSGWTTMGELEPGDFVFDERGIPTYVVDVSPVSTGNPCFEVEFSDGTRVVADAEHLWLTETRADRLSEISLRKYGPTGTQTIARLARTGKSFNTLLGRDQTAKRTYASLVTTGEIATTLMNGPHVNHSIKLAGPLELPESVLPIPPYVLGAWLGDGSSVTARITISETDQQIVQEIRAVGYTLSHIQVAEGKTPQFGILGLQVQLRVAGVLGLKHIPLDYLRASRAQRLALLQGLMDTDGWAPTRGSALFCSTSRRLADDVFGLIASLGMRPHMTARECNGRHPESSIAYTIQYTATLPVFRLERKASRLSTAPRATQDKRYVIAVRPVESVPVRCIKVASESGLFLVTRACIPTHNTTLIANLIMQARRPCVVIAGDSSPYALEAMRARGWRVWSADGKNGGLYVFEGTPNEAAQIVTVLLNPRRTQGDTGLQRGMARGVFRSAIQSMDDSGVARSWPALAEALLNAEPPHGLTNRNFDSAKANWIARIDELMEALGPALGHDLSVLDCVKSECGLFFDLNAFSDLDLAQCFGEAAVRLTQHAADKAGDFWWICDELALFDADLLGQIVRTCRIRRVKFVGASQIISDFGKTLRGLVKIWFVGEQTAADHESRKWCSDLTMGLVSPENFSEHSTPPGFYYVVADGRTQSLQIKPWHHPRPVSSVRLYSQRPAPDLDSTVQPYYPSQKPEITAQDNTVDAGVEETTIHRPDVILSGPPAMPLHWAGDVQLENIWTRTVLPDGLDGCYESTFRTNNSGRPMCTYKSDPEQPTQQWLVYALSLALKDALEMGMDEDERIGYLRTVRVNMASRILTVEHQCENVKCHRTDHLDWSDRGNNVRLYFQRRRQAKDREAAVA